MLLGDARTQITSALVVVSCLFLVFAAVARLMHRRRRPRRHDLGRNEHFVRLVDCGSVKEASRLAAQLRDQGIVALANAKQRPPRYNRRNIKISGGYQAFVAVVSPDVDRAREHLRSLHCPSAGAGRRDASEAEILELLSDEAAEPVEPSTDTFMDRASSWLDRGVRVTMWLIGIAIAAQLIYLTIS
ncbi:MAG: hypothetical protein NXI31_12050 [bacterium]|nr:hypothetical protein [bacterium]